MKTTTEQAIELFLQKHMSDSGYAARYGFLLQWMINVIEENDHLIPKVKELRDDLAKYDDDFFK